MKSKYSKMAVGLIAGLFLTNTLKAQDAEVSDYIIKTNGDTVKCHITSSFLGNSKFYQTANMTKSQKITPAEVKEFSELHQEEYFGLVQKEGSSKPDYFLIIEKGRINLYQDISTVTTMSPTGTFSGTSTETLYVSKDGSSPVPLKTNALITSMSKSKEERKKDFGEMLSDNKAVYDKYMADDKFTLRSLKKIVHLYNKGPKK